MCVNAKILALSLGFGLVASTAAWAQAGVPTAAAKVGIVAIQQAIASTNEGKKELDALQQRFSPRQADLKNQNDEVEKLKQQLQAQGDKLSEEGRASQVRSIETKQKALHRTYNDFQTEVQQAEQEIVNHLGTKMLKVAGESAHRTGSAVTPT